MESSLVLLIEGFTAVVKKYVLKLLVSYPSLLRRSSVAAGSILAAVEHGGGDVGQLFIPIRERPPGYQ